VGACRLPASGLPARPCSGTRLHREIDGWQKRLTLIIARQSLLSGVVRCATLSEQQTLPGWWVSIGIYDGLMSDQRGKRAIHQKQAILNEVSGQIDLLAIRWAFVEEYMALDHYLHRQYVTRFGQLPTYVIRSSIQPHCTRDHLRYSGRITITKTSQTYLSSSHMSARERAFLVWQIPSLSVFWHS